MLEDLIKALGLGPTLPIATGIPDGKEAAMSSVPVVREIPQAPSRMALANKGPQDNTNAQLNAGVPESNNLIPQAPSSMALVNKGPQDNTNAQLNAGVPESSNLISLGEKAGSIYDFGSDALSGITGGLSRMGQVAGNNVMAAGQDIAAGFSGEESNADWDNTDPGSSSQKEYLDGLLAKQSAISEKVFEAPGVKEIVSAADAVKPEAISGLTPEQQALVDEKARIAAELLASDEDTDPKTVMQMAGDALGSLFDDKAIQQALIYYTGARLMGYSASGSGMAAGNLLQKGWAAQNKNATDQAEADRKTDLAALKARTPDRSKTVQMFDTDSKKIIEVNMAPNGDAYPPGSEKGFNAASAGLVTYRPATHKTF